jgi:hypothetical protein
LRRVLISRGRLIREGSRAHEVRREAELSRRLGLGEPSVRHVRSQDPPSRSARLGGCVCA